MVEGTEEGWEYGVCAGELPGYYSETGGGGEFEGGYGQGEGGFMIVCIRFGFDFEIAFSYLEGLEDRFDMALSPETPRSGMYLGS